MSDTIASGPRALARRTFWETAGWSDATENALAADASFRRYFRLTRPDGSRAIVMDAPPEKEDVRPFVAVAEILEGFGYSTPRIVASDLADGFLLLEDLGDLTYTRALAGGYGERELYCLAGDLLADLARRDATPYADILPPYSDEKLLQETLLFVDWYLHPGVGLAIGEGARDAYIEAWKAVLPAARSGPDVLVLRDFHVDNMMVLDGRKGIAACGLLDFQDAVIGPASYDLVSLLQDSRRDIVPEIVGEVMQRYLDAVPELGDRAGFERSYRVLGVQRALKVFGIFARQSVLYGNHGYLVHIPRLWRLTMENFSDDALAPVRDWIEKHVPDDYRVTPPPGGRAP
ncbi:MAG: phosphotransferase [Nisaea sp.]|uniref:aminoglycoside phosphotransferase family protein n=1 Tax=Nisaea sp. TaxID=2024842 RepID=UPI001B1E913E|nr:phosphotransferase [Nisaea sp.]MBO6559415.1 phosphotransferase [Nisaea sp.]